MDERKNARKPVERMLEWQGHFACPAEAWPKVALELIASSPYSLTHIAEHLDIGRTTLYRALKGQPGLIMRHAIVEGLKLLQT